MADIDLIRAHDLGLKGARAAAERLAADLGHKFDVRGVWEGNVLNFQRPGVSGSLAITDKELRLAVSLGLMMKAMRGSIEKAIVHELDALFPQKAAAAIAKKAPPSRKKGG